MVRCAVSLSVWSRSVNRCLAELVVVTDVWSALQCKQVSVVVLQTGSGVGCSQTVMAKHSTTAEEKSDLFNH